MPDAPVLAFQLRSARRGWLASILVVLAVGLGGCSAAATTTTTTVGPRPVSPPLTVPSGHSSPGPATPPFEIAPVSIEIAGSVVTVKLAQRLIDAPLRVVQTAPGPIGDRLAFSIAGAAYVGRSVSASAPAPRLVSRVTVGGSASGVRVVVRLRRRPPDHRFSIRGDQVVLDL
jgi:hypothetical protein